MLRLEEFSCGYGSLTVVEDLALEVRQGEIFALIGPNGAGKSSTIMSIAGHVQVKKGRILLKGQDITGVPVTKRVEIGIAIVPEGRRLFSDMSVQENLAVGCYSLPKSEFNRNREKVLALFPRLAERIDHQASFLSGGEQQMLAIGRALMADPELLIIDELSLGLMPKVIDLCYQAIMALREQGVTILLVEQNTTRALEVSDRICVLESGRAVWQGTAAEAMRDPELVKAYLGLS
jgi:branched-chain amino acid transport system ATP-binding protein